MNIEIAQRIVNELPTDKRSAVMEVYMYYRGNDIFRAYELGRAHASSGEVIDEEELLILLARC